MSYAQGCDIERSLVALSAPVLKGRLRLEYFNGHDWSGPVVHTKESGSAELVFFGQPGPGVDPEAFSVRASGVLVAEATGEHTLGLVQLGRCRILLDGETVLDATEGDYAQGDDFFGMGSEVITAPVQLTVGRETPIVIEYSSRDSFMLCGVRVGLKSEVERDLMAEAGETAANPKTVVVVNTGGACNLDWAIEPAVPFGHGLSYATFEWSEPRVSGGSDTDMADPVIVEVDVVNTGDRSGSDVVQVYVEPPPSLLHRPVRELKGFAKVHLAPGERTTARIVLNRRAFAYYDPGDQAPQGLDSMSPVPAGESHKRTDPGWYVDPGPYTIWTARSSANLAHPAEISLGDRFRRSSWS